MVSSHLLTNFLLNESDICTNDAAVRPTQEAHSAPLVGVACPLAFSQATGLSDTQQPPGLETPCRQEPPHDPTFPRPHPYPAQGRRTAHRLVPANCCSLLLTPVNSPNTQQVGTDHPRNTLTASPTWSLSRSLGMVAVLPAGLLLN